MEAIKKHGEQGLLTLLADQEGIEKISPEPDEVLEIKELVKHFSKEDIEYYYFARVVAQWNRLIDKPDFEEYLNRYLTRDGKNSGWTDFEFTIENMAKIHDKTHDHKFDSENYQCFYRDSAPNVNPVADYPFRDEHILNEILKYWKQGKSIFVVFGSGHAIVLEKALNTLLV